MASSAAQTRAYRGPALFTYGFRPFFLFGALWAALAVLIWLPMLAGRITLPTHFAPLEWHVHELVYGYVPAVIAGFLLTAVPNWTGRLPVVGPRLMRLFALWAAGRLALLTSAWIGAPVAVAIDVAFLVALAAVIAREIIAGNNWRNLKVVIALGVLTLGNVLFHLEALDFKSGGHGQRLGIAATVLLVMLIGGRIIPSFTRNWLARQAGGRLPTAFNALDIIIMVESGVVLALWVVMPDSILTGWLAALVGLLNVVRLVRWAGDRTLREPLVLVLHVAYAFVPIGFVLLAVSVFAPQIVPPAGAVHGWTAGCIGLMTLAVMTRASLGHTGQPLIATPGIRAIYVFAFMAALARVIAAFGLWQGTMLEIAALAWGLAFGGFVLVYAPLLARRAA
jgi:uncharacterized protein involved in response to NO